MDPTGDTWRSRVSPKDEFIGRESLLAEQGKDIKNKAKQCITCFRSGKKLNSVIPENEVNHLPKLREVGEEVQIDFIGPVLKKRIRRSK